MAELQQSATQHGISRDGRIYHDRHCNFSEANIPRDERFHPDEHCDIYDILDDLDYFGGESGKPNRYMAMPALRKSFLRWTRSSTRIA